jgi:outer membrane protein OmpA-like peptidoglycan-associated protein/Tol biopolymer transport system component
MKKYTLLFVIAIFSVSIPVYSQVSEAFRTKYTLAESYLNDENYQDALPIYLYLDTLTPGNPNISFNIGVCYVNSIYEKKKAIPFLKNAIENVSLDYVGLPEDITAPVFAFYYLGRAYHVNDSIDQAIKYFEKFKYYLTENDAELLKDVNRQIEMCYNAKKLMANPVNIKIENLGDPVNSEFPDYSPVISQDESTIIFTSRRVGSTGGKKDSDGKYFEDIYIAYYNPATGKWVNMRKIGANINSNGHEASISMSLDGKQLFIYKDDNGDGNIYVSYFKSDDWTAPEKLSAEINSKGWETHATLSPDGNTLYFISNKSGGYGGRDIWRSEKLANGKWSEAVNLGPKINTEYDEESPFMMPDGVTLYFSSKGHESMGGFDIFTATQSEDGYWSAPENLGYPINTTDDDVFYVPTADEKHAYYSSAKEGGLGDQDIYKLSIIAPKKLVAHLKGIIFDELSYKPVAAKLEITDAKSNDIIASFTSDELNGDYYVSLPTGKTYNMVVTADKYLPYKETIEISDTITDPEINKAIIMKKIILVANNTTANTDTTKTSNTNIDDSKIMFDNKEIIIGERIVLENVLFDFDKFTLRPESTTELDKWVKFLTDNATLKIEILGHTDNKGTAEYNNTLSDNRAKAVYDYFVSKGINKDRMKWKGYGFDLPIASNKTDEGRQKNRRTEIKITSRY